MMMVMGLAWHLVTLGLLPLLAGPEPAPEDWQHLGLAGTYSFNDTTQDYTCGPSRVRIHAYNDDVVRVTLAPLGQYLPGDSWALVDDHVRGSFLSTDPAMATLVSETWSLKLIAHRRDCRLEFRDLQDRPIFREDEERGMSWLGSVKGSGGRKAGGWRARPVRDWIHLPEGAAVYGLGDYRGPLNRRGRVYRLWNSGLSPDQGEGGAGAQSIPFVIVGHQGRYHGLFYNSNWPITFDIGAAEPGFLSFGASGGVLSYFVVPGPDPKEVVRRYTGVTGRMPLPPRWALGAHQTRLGWNSADHLLETAKSLSARGLGCDVFYFDLPSQDGYRVFTWNTERFSEPRQVTEALKAVGAHTMLVVQAGFKEDAADPLYMQGGQLDAWVTRVNGMPFVGQTESGLTVYPDFTSDAVSGWWQELLAAFLVDAGVEGVWFDRNQPVVLGGPDGTLPPDLKVKSWGLQADLVTCHNVYAASAAQSAYEGVRRAWPDGRALVLATSSFAGGQRYAGSAAAVVVKSWADLRSSLSNVLNLGLSGISLVGTGIDTRSKDMSGELYARWLQLNSLLPIGRAHTAWADSQTGDWARSKSLDGVAKRALQLRYSLMPYLYTLLEESSRIGLPLARPVWMEFPGAGDVDAEQGFMLGESLYVVPVMQAGAQRLTLRLPPGSWYSMGSGRRFQGGQEVTLPVTLDNLPVFVRGGAIIPMQSPTGTLAEHPSEPLILAVWPDGSSKASLYEDDGATPAHDQGQFRRTALTCKASGRSIEVTLGAAKGQFVAAGRSPLVRVYGLTGRIGQVTCLSGKAVHGSDTHAARSISRDQPAGARPLTEPGAFARDAESGAWQVRLYPDEGQRQKLTITLAD